MDDTAPDSVSTSTTSVEETSVVEVPAVTPILDAPIDPDSLINPSEPSVSDIGSNDDENTSVTDVPVDITSTSDGSATADDSITTDPAAEAVPDEPAPATLPDPNGELATGVSDQPVDTATAEAMDTVGADNMAALASPPPADPSGYQVATLSDPNAPVAESADGSVVVTGSVESSVENTSTDTEESGNFATNTDDNSSVPVAALDPTPTSDSSDTAPVEDTSTVSSDQDTTADSSVSTDTDQAAVSTDPVSTTDDLTSAEADSAPTTDSSSATLGTADASSADDVFPADAGPEAPDSAIDAGEEVGEKDDASPVDTDLTDTNEEDDTPAITLESIYTKLLQELNELIDDTVDDLDELKDAADVLNKLVDIRIKLGGLS